MCVCLYIWKVKQPFYLFKSQLVKGSYEFVQLYKMYTIGQGFLLVKA